MQVYKASDFVSLNPEEIERIQSGRDEWALRYIDEHSQELAFLDCGNDRQANLRRLKENFSGTMDKLRLITNAIVTGMKTRHNTGFPETICSIDLHDGSIETDRNGRFVNYSTEVLTPCTSTLLHYVNREANDVYVIFPPIKSPERTLQKIIQECIRERDEFRDENIVVFKGGKNENKDKVNLANIRNNSYIDFDTSKKKSRADGTLLKIAKKDILPKDIFRLTITSKYPMDLEILIQEFTEKFPEYIKFEEGERNAYKKNLSENERAYFDIKKTAVINVPGTDKYFFVEFQFKQTLMFFAQIRSHAAYEEYRVAYAEYINAKKIIEHKKNADANDKLRLETLKKSYERKREICITIHKNAAHQSNLYLMHKIMWLDNNSKGLGRKPEKENGCYQCSINELLNNYIVESYDNFDGKKAFSDQDTPQKSYLNRVSFLKALRIFPESFDELGKGAKQRTNKAWSRLTKADLQEFERISDVAVKYESVIRDIQKKRKLMDPVTLMNVIAETQRDM